MIAPMSPKSLVPLMSLLAFGCTEPVEPAPEPMPADGAGGYQVGVTTVELTDGSRDGRTLEVEVWYPARPDPDAFHESYDLEAGALRLGTFVSPLGAVRDAEPDRRGGPWPVVLFSHGSGGTRYQSVFLSERLVSHGMVVIAPDHAGNTMGDLLFGEDTDMARSAMDRPLDLSFLIDELVERTDQTLPMLSGLLDADRIAASGHSFGGYTCLAVAGAELDLDEGRAYCADHPDEVACSLVDDFEEDQHTLSFRDPRVRACVALAPGGYQLLGARGMALVDVPTMIQGGDADRTTPLDLEQEPMYAALGSPSWLAVFRDAGHFTFTDMCRLVDMYGREAFEDIGANVLTDGCNEENIEPAVAHEILMTLTTALFQIVLEEREEARQHIGSGPHVELRSR
jgi:predicted dienelactone hydrolase